MNRAHSRIAAFALVAAGLFASVAPSHGYRMIQNTTTGRVTSGSQVACNATGGFTHWNTRNIIWYHNAAGQGAGKETALANAMSSWTNVTGANHVLTYMGRPVWAGPRTTTIRSSGPQATAARAIASP